jgi:hypothetical protein
MRIWIFGGMMALAFAAAAHAADDDMVRGFLAACDAGDQVCLMDVVSGAQQAIYAHKSCPAYDKEAIDVRDEVAASLKAAVARTPALADQKTSDAVIRTVQALYPCPPPAN